MRVLIDNLDGRGAVDWSDQLMAEGPLTIERRLNRPTTCRWMMRDASSSSGLVRPSRTARVVVTDEGGNVLFTGYLPQEPAVYAIGWGSSGPVYQLELEAISDEWLLDKQGVHVSDANFSLGADALLRSLTNRVDGSRLAIATTGTLAQLGSVTTTTSKSWSENAAAIADAAGASYRVLAGELRLSTLGAVTHTLSVVDDSLAESGLRLAPARALANDVTISGEIEAGTYVTEVFVGDGTTSEFALAQTPFRGEGTSDRLIVSDTFTAPLDPQRWGGGDPGSHLSVGPGGLMLSGGNGLDGQTTLIATGAAEMGGVLLLQAEGVALAQGSDGVLLGLYSGAVSRANCVAGFNVRQVNGSTVLGCLVNGAAAGTTLTVLSGHLYRLQIFAHSPETQRVRQSYVTISGGAVRQFGGALVEAPVDLLFAVEDLGVSSNTPATILFDGTLASSPASVLFAPVNSVQLNGSIASVLAERLAPAWVHGTTSTGVQVTRVPGTAGTGADFALAAGGTLRYFPGRVPVAGETVRVQYRLPQRAIARVQDSGSVAAEAQGGLPGVAVWSGSVLEPVTRSSEDCAAAAQALLSVALSRPEALAGTYEANNLGDIWPGDRAVFVTSAGAIGLTVRAAHLRDGLAAPERVGWKLEVANDWAECASIQVSGSLATDAADVPPGYGSSSVAGIGGLQVISVSKTAIQIDGGVAPPSGGGFEVRHSESFGPGAGADLVLRSAVRGFTIPRAAQVERFYVRVYDGSTPPMYSRLSAVIVVNVPVG